MEIIKLFIMKKKLDFLIYTLFFFCFQIAYDAVIHKNCSFSTNKLTVYFIGSIFLMLGITFLNKLIIKKADKVY